MLGLIEHRHFLLTVGLTFEERVEDAERRVDCALIRLNAETFRYRFEVERWKSGVFRTRLSYSEKGRMVYFINRAPPHLEEFT
jgi:hypothetical protein